MKRLALLIATVAAVAAVFLPVDNAHACQRRNGKLVCGDNTTPVYNKGAVFFDAPATMNDGGAGITFSGRGILVYDFPSVPATGAGSGCLDSAAGTANGCRFGDTLALGIDQVPPANLNANLPQPYISAADAFKVRVCNDSSDGGAVDWPDASYTVRCSR